MLGKKKVFRYGALSVNSGNELLDGGADKRKDGIMTQVVIASTIVGTLLTFTVLLFTSSAVNNALSTMFDVSTKTTLSAFATATLNRHGYTTIDHMGQSETSYLSYNFLASYRAIVEPFQPMSLNLDEDDIIAGNTYKFTICKSEDSSDCSVGSYSLSIEGDEATETVTSSCAPYDELTVSIQEYDSSDVATYRSSSLRALCLYVRREISQLTTDDLKDTMDAMHKLWEVSDIDGLALYGENYHSAKWFSEAHHFNAARQESDHIHEGLGFLIQHIKLTNLFEKSMQSVNPAVTMPYWESTIEQSDGKSLFESFIFTEDTFGSLKEPVDDAWGFLYKNDLLTDGNIQDGRWKNLLADTNERYPDIQSSFSLLRAPWNLSPSPYVSRFTSADSSLPACSDYSILIAQASPILFLNQVQKGSHAPIHASIGNTFGCDVFDEFLTSGVVVSNSTQLRLCRTWSFYVKDLYRANYLTPVTGCDNSDFDSDPNNVDKCGYKCNEDSYDDMLGFIQELFDGKTFLAESTVSTTTAAQIRSFICDGDSYKVAVGAQSESASAADPSFWPIHPTQERLLHAYFMATQTASFTWPTDSTLDYVCDTPSCYVDSKGSKDTYDLCCYGHYETDQLLDFINGDSSAGYGDTNHQILMDTNPLLNSYSMPYVYDSFSYDHCDSTDGSLGLNDLLKVMYSKAINMASSNKGV